ncbi:MAG: hypothetical protein ACOCUL_05115 [Bacteroidota bacterium]
MNYDKITGLEYETNCSSITIGQWTELMKGAKRANKKKINTLIKKFLPDVYRQLALDFYNPYNYYRTDTHFIVVHSSIEHFFKYTIKK